MRRRRHDPATDPQPGMPPLYTRQLVVSGNEVDGYIWRIMSVNYSIYGPTERNGRYKSLAWLHEQEAAERYPTEAEAEAAGREAVAARQRRAATHVCRVVETLTPGLDGSASVDAGE